MLGVRPLGQRAGVLERPVQDPGGADAALAQVLHRERGHLARADDHDVAPAEVAERLGGEVGAERDERIGRRAERGLLAHPPTGPRRRVEHPGEAGARRAFRGRASQRLAHLRVDLRLAEHHGIEPRRDLEQMVGRVAFPMGVQRVAQFVGRDVARLAQHPLQPEEPGVVGRDGAVDLDPVARRQDHGLLDPRLVEGEPVRLREVVVGEREPFQQLDGGATEGDAEAKDAHVEQVS